MAAALAAYGIRVYDASHGYEPLPSDTDYGDRTHWADFDQQGRLVTASYDGFLRLYAAGRYDTPIAKVKGRGGNRPFSAVFSPGGLRVAVGYTDSTAVDLHSGQDLAFIQAADASGVAGPNIFAAGWSADGRYLFAGGEGNRYRIRRWGNSGAGPHLDIDNTHNTVMELLPLKDGGVLFAAQDPAFGTIDRQGRATTLQGPGQLELEGNIGSLRLSASGKTVEQGTNFPQHIVRFALAERHLDIDPPADDTLAAPLIRSTRLGRDRLEGRLSSFRQRAADPAR